MIIVGLNETTWPRWETTLRAFTAASKGGSRFRPVIVALLTPECEGSARAIGAPLIPWRNVIGYRDAMLWALEHLPERNDPLLDRLVAETAVQLAGWELDEVARLVEIFSSTVGRMFEPSECLRKSPLAPDWASGSADWLDGNGFRALGCCDSNEIARRVWQAQANVLFSWLETERLNFLRRYRRDFGGCQDPDSLEWADIAEIMKTKFGPRDRRSQLAAEARRARNALAHLKTISLDDLRRIRSLVQMDMRVK